MKQLVLLLNIQHKQPCQVAIMKSVFCKNFIDPHTTHNSAFCLLYLKRVAFLFNVLWRMATLASNALVDVRFQHGGDPDVDTVIPVNKSWTWSTLLTEIATSISVSAEQISHLVLLNKSGSEISMNICDFAKFKRILNMYSNPSEMKFNVLFCKSVEDNKSMRPRFCLSTNLHRNLDIAIPVNVGWKDIVDLISTEFSFKEPVHHLLFVNPEGGSEPKEINTAEAFWSVCSLDYDGVFVVYTSAEDPQSGLTNKITPAVAQLTSKSSKNTRHRHVSVPKQLGIAQDNVMPSSPLDFSANGSKNLSVEAAPAPASNSPATSILTHSAQDTIERSTAKRTSPKNNNDGEKLAVSRLGTATPRPFQNQPLPTEPVTVLFCISDDKKSTVGVTISDFESWTGLIDTVCDAFGINVDCVLYFYLVDKNDEEISPYLRNAEKFWRVFSKKYSAQDHTKFIVEIDQNRRLAQKTVFATVRLGTECQMLSPASPAREVAFPLGTDWAGLSKAFTKEFGFPAVSVHHFIVIDADGDEMSPHLCTIDAFWKALSTFAGDNGDALSVHLDEQAVGECMREIAKQEFIKSSARFTVAFDCDQGNKTEGVVVFNSSWLDIVEAIESCLSPPNGSKLQKLVLVDADGISLSPDITNEKKFWKIYNVKYKNTAGSYFICTFVEPSRQKSFFDLCSSGMQTSTLLNFIRQGVDVNAACTDESTPGCAGCNGIHLAAMAGHEATMRVLCSLEYINVHQEDALGRTPLYLACKSGSGECMRLLVDKGATFQGKDGTGKTALHMLAMSGFDVVTNHEQKLREILQSRVTIHQVNAFDDTRSTPLMYACKRGDPLVAKLLVEFGAIINLRDKDGMSPLLHCVGSGSCKLLTYILQQKPNVSARNNAGDDALLLAAATNNQRMAKCLIDHHMDIQTRSSSGLSLYHVAEAASFSALAQWFADQGAKKNVLSTKAQRHLLKTDYSLENRLRAEEYRVVEEILGIQIKDSEEDSFNKMPLDSAQSSEPEDALFLNVVNSKLIDIPKEPDTNTHQKMCNVILQLEPRDCNSTAKTSIFNACKRGDVDSVDEICRAYDNSIELGQIVTTSGESLMHIACFNFHLDLCKFLHERGVSVTAKDSSGYTPFHFVCEEGIYDIAAWIVNLEASCAVIDDKLMTPMHYACRQQHCNIIRLLLGLPDCTVSAKDDNGKTPVQYVAAWSNVTKTEIQLLLLDILKSSVPDVQKCAEVLLLDASLFGLITVVEYIVNMNCCSINITSLDDGQSTLHRACRGGNLDVAKLLVNNGADINLRDFNEMTPFLYACASQNLELVKFLASSGPKSIVSAVNQDDENGLDFSIRNRDTEMVKWLLQRGLDCTQQNFKKYAATGLPEALELQKIYQEHQLAQVVPKPKDRKVASCVDHDAMTIFDLCSSGEIGALLESGDNLDVELRDGSGFTALHIACERGNYSVVAMLTKNGCHLNREAANSETPLSLACRNGHIDICRLLVDLGVDCLEPVADTTLFHIASSNEHYDILEWLSSIGVSVDVIDSSGFSPMHIACRDNAMETVKKLFELGADIGVNEINAPLHVACFLGNLEIAKWLVDKGAEPSAVHEGRSAFLIACSGGQLEVAMWLDSIGADINCVNEEDGLTALHRACIVENVELARWLLSRNPGFVRCRASDEKSPLSISLLACNDELVDLCEKWLLTILDEDTALDEIRDDIIDLLGVAMLEEDFSAAPFMLKRLMLHTDPKYVFSDGSTVLHFAAALGDVELLSHLISNNAVIDSRSAAGKTPLHYAAITGEINCAELLIAAGADCLAKDTSDRNAMQFAQHFKRKLFIKWLRRLPAYIEATTMTSGSFFFACIPVGTASAGVIDFSDSDCEGISEHSKANSEAFDDTTANIDESSVIIPSV